MPVFRCLFYDVSAKEERELDIKEKLYFLVKQKPFHYNVNFPHTMKTTKAKKHEWRVLSFEIPLSYNGASSSKKWNDFNVTETWSTGAIIQITKIELSVLAME